MTYADVRDSVRTGDIFLVEGRRAFSWVIRILLGQQFSHVALAWWWNDGLYIAEMVEGTGFQIMPASQWVTQQGGKIFLGVAPKVVQDNAPKVVDFINATRADKKKQSYGYLSLLMVAAGQIFQKNVPTHSKVCSTFVQAGWQAAGYQCDETESPGGLIEHVQSITPLEG
jgi:hypothetical protein